MKKSYIFYVVAGAFSFFNFTSVSSFVVDQYDSCTVPGNFSTPLPLQSTFSLVRPKISSTRVDTNPLHLRKIVEDMLLYLKKVGKNQRHYTQPKEFTARYMSLRKVQQTLRFIKKTIDEDEFFQRKYRILDQKFIQKNFGFFAWKNPIRITRYTVYSFKGSSCKTKKYNCALYGLINKYRVPAFTKQQVLSGVFEKNLKYKEIVKPLVWVTRDDLEKALMEGHALISMQNGMVRAFSVHKNNGILYDKSELQPKNQQRYWFFTERNSRQIKDFYNKCINRKDVMFAGDIESIGLGKVIMVDEKDPDTGKFSIRLGLLADTGGAFKDNLGQLDQFIGVSISTEPVTKDSYVQAYVLYKK